MKKIIIYQVLPRLFGNDNDSCVYNGSIAENQCGKMNDFTPSVLKQIRELGVTHIWYTGLIEHATQTDYSAYGIRTDHPSVVKGKAGSPYAIKDYYDIDPDLAEEVPHRMKEFEALVARTHRAGLKVIMDFVPNHVARQYHSDAKPSRVKDFGEGDNKDVAFSADNNFYYLPRMPFRPQFDLKGTAEEPYEEFPAKATGNDCFRADPNMDDWYETVKLNYGVDYMNGRTEHFSPIPNTWLKMLNILTYWTKKGVDGFRCDMAEMVPVDFWEWVIPRVKGVNSQLIFIAEVYNPKLYHLYVERGHFDYLYDKVGLYDTLHNIICGYGSAASISSCWQSLNGLDTKMVNFLENHDEQRVASDFFAKDPFHALPAVISSACMNTNPFLLYFGQELGEMGMDNEGFSGRDGKTTIFDYWSVPTVRLWRNGLKMGTGESMERMMELRSIYQRILCLCNEEKAISEGSFFDLTYANLNGWKFNEYKQFAFMRKHDNELLLIAVNFDCQQVDVAINIPSHAFDFLNIPQKDAYEAEDLLTGRKETISLLPYKATELTLHSYYGKILKIRL